MKQDDKEKWVEEVLQSMDGLERANPNPDLFSKIEDGINLPETKIIPFNKWKYAAAGAVLIMFMNTNALLYYYSNASTGYEEVASADVYDQSLISMSQIY